MKQTDSTFYNTIQLEGEELKKARSKALTQDEHVLAFFRDYDNLGATPERVLRHFQIMEGLNENKWANTPITSIRRSFSNLSRTEDKFGNPITPKIYKTDTMVKGDYGKQIHIWKLCK